MSEKTEVASSPETAAIPQLVKFRCRVGHELPMLPGSLAIEMVIRDGENKPTALFRTNQLCPACVMNVLNQLFETFPAPAAPAAADQASEQTEEVK